MSNCVGAGALDLREDVVMDGRAAGADREGRQRKVDGEEFRQHPFGLRSGDADRGAAMRQVGHRADVRASTALAKAVGQPFRLVDDEEFSGREAEGRLASPWRRRRRRRRAASGRSPSRMAAISAFSSPGQAASWTIEPGCVSDRMTPTPCSKLPCEPGWSTGSSGDCRSTMHAAPFRIEEMVADDLDRPEAVAQRVGDEGARAVARLAALDQRQRDIFAERRRIAARR